MRRGYSVVYLYIIGVLFYFEPNPTLVLRTAVQRDTHLTYRVELIR
jgi:hypothetical protein